MIFAPSIVVVGLAVFAIALAVVVANRWTAKLPKWVKIGIVLLLVFAAFGIITIVVHMLGIIE